MPNKKPIEVALTLDATNVQSTREKSARHRELGAWSDVLIAALDEALAQRSGEE